jgi:hypothetical protein
MSVGALSSTASFRAPPMHMQLKMGSSSFLQQNSRLKEMSFSAAIEPS